MSMNLRVITSDWREKFPISCKACSRRARELCCGMFVEYMKLFEPLEKAFAANHSAWPPPGPVLERAREGAVVGKTQKISDFTKTHAALEILKSQFFPQLTQDIGEGRPFFL